jgi:hypothetical protein
MTAAENQAIQILTEMVKGFDRANKDAHDQISGLIRDVEKRLCAKITDSQSEIQAIVEHCRAREQEVNAQLAERKIMFEQEIETAKESAVREATAPSVYAQATEGLAHFAARVLVTVATLATIGGGLFVILDKLHLL